VAELIATERAQHRLIASLASRKMWLRLRSRSDDVARCTVERIMRLDGWEGARYGRRQPRNTAADPAAARSADLVGRDFSLSGLNRLWVADFTYCPTWTGMAYVAFVIDAYARRVIGWRAAARMDHALVPDALEHAIFTRRQAGDDRPGRPDRPQRRRLSIHLHRPDEPNVGGRD
jgi:putative transposase